jgi:hypothetical protein
MDTKKRTSLVGGIILILLGVIFAVTQIVHIEVGQSWPFYIIGAGVLLFVLGAFLGVPDMAIPACIIAGIGGILYWQASQVAAIPNIYASWAYTWALIPGFVGIGMALAALMGAHKRYPIFEIINTILTSLVLFSIFFAIFAPMFGHMTGLLGKYYQYWPLLLVVAGVLVLIRAFIHPHRHARTETITKVAPPAMPEPPAIPAPPPAPEMQPETREPEVISEAIKAPVQESAPKSKRSPKKATKKEKR